MSGNFIDRLRSIDLQILVDPDLVAKLISTIRIVLIIGSLILGIILVRAIIDSQVSSFLDQTLASSATTQPEIKLATSQPKNYQIIVDKNIFGAIAVPPPKTEKPAEVKPISKLPLSLLGTYLSDGNDSYAIIENQKSKEQDVFLKGEKIFNEADLVKIFADKVEINRNGELETLLLDEIPGMTASAPGEGGVTSVNENEFVIDEAELDKALENLPLLLQQARAVPYFKNGQAVGLRLFAIRPDSLYTKIGLRNGDIMLNINGKALGDLTEAIKLFETLKTERSFTLVLERNRETREFKYDVR